jgi:hypothetical protein
MSYSTVNFKGNTSQAPRLVSGSKWPHTLAQEEPARRNHPRGLGYALPSHAAPLPSDFRSTHTAPLPLPAAAGLSLQQPRNSLRAQSVARRAYIMPGLPLVRHGQTGAYAPARPPPATDAARHRARGGGELFRARGGGRGEIIVAGARRGSRHLQRCRKVSSRPPACPPPHSPPCRL